MYNVECLVCKFNNRGKCDLNKVYCQGCDEICDYCFEKESVETLYNEECSREYCRVQLCSNPFCHNCIKFQENENV